jgi:hypothetical protein
LSRRGGTTTPPTVEGQGAVLVEDVLVVLGVRGVWDHRTVLDLFNRLLIVPLVLVRVVLIMLRVLVSCTRYREVVFGIGLVCGKMDLGVRPIGTAPSSSVGGLCCVQRLVLTLLT